MKRKKSFFVSYEVNVDMWDAEDFDPEVDFFDLEDMLASRYWLKRLKKEGRLTAEEQEKFHKLEEKFRKLGIPEFVKSHFPGVYERWIAEVEIMEAIPVNLADILTGIVDSKRTVKPHWKGEKDEGEEVQQIAA